MTRQEILIEVVIEAVDQPVSNMVRLVHMIREYK